MRDYRTHPLSDEERRAIRVIREQMAWWGLDMSDLTDEKVAEGTERFADVVRQASLTMAEATAAFSALGRAFAGMAN